MRRPVLNSYLHSIMLLLYRGTPGYLGTTLIDNLHSIMLLLYLNTSPNLAVSLDYLHSIMLLLYRHLDLRAGHVFKFTFHYASTLSNFSEISINFSPVIFTFHYASTLSDHVRGWWGLLPAFTFHYASTLSSSACRSLSLIALYLHSIMLLLYPSALKDIWPL